LSLLAAADGKGVFYLGERRQPDPERTFGRLDLETLALTPIMSFTNQLKGFFAFDPQARRVAFAQEKGDQCELVVLEKGVPVLTRLLGAKGENWAFSSAAFTPRGDALCASFRRTVEGQKGAAYGLVEIPLNNSAIRQVTLLSTAETGDDSNALLFQAGISHDGAMAAVASTYLACQIEALKPEDCALFFIDLKDPKLKVTKVAIPMPARRPGRAVK
jgi:hypothetical protein